MVNDLHVTVALAKKGDQSAFRQLVTAYKSTVYRHAFALLNDRMEAEDVTQEAFVKAYYNLSKLESEYAFVSWLTRVVTNLCNDRNRKKSKKKVLLSEEPIENSSIQMRHTPIENIVNKMSIKEAMGKIPIVQRNILVLREIQGYSYVEISDLLKIPLGTVKSRINAARENLKKELQEG